MADYNNISLDPVRPSWLPEGMTASMVRLDKLDPVISGNKWFKLKYNLEAARQEGYQTIITFGGAWSNHIAATAQACRENGLSCIGIIRGDEMQSDTNPTLRHAAANGMQLRFVSRAQYSAMQLPGNPDLEKLRQEGFVIPEGGHNAAGARGCEEILSLFPLEDYSHILCAAGTGTTAAGLINAAGVHQEVLAIAVLKGAGFLEQAIADLLSPQHLSSWKLLTAFHQGGYGKINQELIAFMNEFYLETGIPTDIIYTGKMVMAFRQLLEQQYFPAHSKILLIHTGGLQGNQSQQQGILAF
ncbi:1-aminocyclopropane-1-carboxylate deaminase [Chitinophaga dinghuensis]|uniref:1-aminocyclopropane-1-carboxylate deaminase n=1 Tax=Chitinophaga dinghuensis TaxID=1539050 RepID=A0A327WAH6_9BACT|nr:pyridoxal-phosphate dependent enzyme [Chitinophaga dinghuensis]RAJ87737.1 1-aminocyclopropane-1-carboxylate deaminase [Chitinophaga dinghuensis]